MRMNEERKEKEKRDELYQEMLRTAKVESDKLATAIAKVESDKQVTAMHKEKMEANKKDVFELNETSGPW
eukprot:13444180-Heterocapsa_arctica.AAC.1